MKLLVLASCLALAGCGAPSSAAHPGGVDCHVCAGAKEIKRKYSPEKIACPGCLGMGRIGFSPEAADESSARYRVWLKGERREQDVRWERDKAPMDRNLARLQQESSLFIELKDLLARHEAIKKRHDELRAHPGSHSEFAEIKNLDHQVKTIEKRIKQIDEELEEIK